mmetsp:Transcript_50179/g.60362  ORF Transcript_50179/g.60362 Transcript_50179/m.60362 type:complete len:290 (-) Transcript_50179:255-1124(-)
MIDLTSYAAALLFFGTNLLRVIQRAERLANHESMFQERPHYDLDPTYIQEQWVKRADGGTLIFVAGFLNTLAWLFLCVPIVQVGWILSKRGTHKIASHFLLMALAVVGTVVEVIARLMMAGLRGSTVWLSEKFNLANWTAQDSNDGIGWRVLEMIHVATDGLAMWVDAFEWIALTGVLTIIFFSTRSQWKDQTNLTPSFGLKWSRFGFFIGFLCFFDFLANILRIVEFRRFNRIALGITIVNMLIFFPVWLIIMGMQLHSNKIQEYTKQSMENSEVVEEGIEVEAEDGY